VGPYALVTLHNKEKSEEKFGSKANIRGRRKKEILVSQREILTIRSSGHEQRYFVNTVTEVVDYLLLSARVHVHAEGPIPAGHSQAPIMEYCRLTYDALDPAVDDLSTALLVFACSVLLSNPCDYLLTDLYR